MAPPKPEYYYPYTEPMTIREMAEVSGIPEATLRQRIKNQGMTPLQALEAGVTRAKKYAYKGKLLTLPEWSIESGVPIGTLRTRIRRDGMTIAEAISKPRTRIKRYSYNGDHLTLSDISKSSGVPKYTLDYRINHRGMTAEQAASLGKREPEKYNYRGESRTLVEWSNLTGIEYPTLLARIQRNKMSLAQAIEKPVRRRRLTPTTTTADTFPAKAQPFTVGQKLHFEECKNFLNPGRDTLITYFKGSRIEYAVTYLYHEESRLLLVTGYQIL